MPALITELIDSPDTFEVVRDAIAAILKVESVGQQQLATSDAHLWALRVFIERSNPWEAFKDGPDIGDECQAPIVNVWFHRDAADESKSNVVERQHMDGTFHVDCYGYAPAREHSSGHTPGDEGAALEAHRALRLCRGILLAGHYTFLGMRGTVWRRWPQSRETFQPPLDARKGIHVVGARLAMRVEYDETAPQVQGEIIETITAQVKRDSTGEVLIDAEYEIPAP